MCPSGPSDMRAWAGRCLEMFVVEKKNRFLRCLQLLVARDTLFASVLHGVASFFLVDSLVGLQPNDTVMVLSYLTACCGQVLLGRWLDTFFFPLARFVT